MDENSSVSAEESNLFLNPDSYYVVTEIVERDGHRGVLKTYVTFSNGKRIAKERFIKGIKLES